MSVNFNRAKYNNAKTNREYKKLLLNDLYPLYWDEGIVFYPRKNKGTTKKEPKLYSYQIRMYKTWKHNRKIQWK